MFACLFGFFLRILDSVRKLESTVLICLVSTCRFDPEHPSQDQIIFYSVLRVHMICCGVSAVDVWRCGKQTMSSSLVIYSNSYTALVKRQCKGSLLRLLFLSTSYQAPLGRNSSTLNEYYFNSMSSLKRLLGSAEC